MICNEQALREAVANGVGWKGVTALYNAATGQIRRPNIIKALAVRRGLKLAHRPNGRPPKVWDDAILARIMGREPRPTWKWAAELYRRATGEKRTPEAIKTRWSRKPRRPAAVRGPGEQPIDDAAEIRRRAEKLREYKDRHGIFDRQVTPAEFDEAMHGDPSTWPDSADLNPGDTEILTIRTPRVYRVMRGRAS